MRVPRIVRDALALYFDPLRHITRSPIWLDLLLLILLITLVLLYP